MKKSYFLLSLIALPCLLGCGGSKKASITINNKVDVINYGNTYQLDVKTKNINKKTGLIYTVSDESVVAISDAGLITTKSIGHASVTVSYRKNKEINDSFSFVVTTDFIEGVVKDEDGKPLEKVHVSYGTESLIDTDKNGKYLLPVSGVGNVICYEKEGYLSHHYIPSFYEVNGQHFVKDVTLKKSEEGNKVTINGVLKNIHGEAITDIVALTIYQNHGFQTTKCDASGNFKFTDVYVGEDVAIGAFHNKYNLKVATFKLEDLSGNIEIILEPYQEDMFMGVAKSVDPASISDYRIIGHAYRIDTNKDGTTDGVKFSLEANFPAFVEQNYFAVCVDAGKDVCSSPKHGRKTVTGMEQDKNDFDITFQGNANVYEAYSYEGDGKLLDDTGIEFEYDEKDPTVLSIYIPYDITTSLGTFNATDTFGFYFWSYVNNVKYQNNFECNIFGHTMTEKNQLSYVRLDKDNVAYAGTDNDKPEGCFISNAERLNWETTISSTIWKFATNVGEDPIIGQVGHNFNYGYQFKVAKNKTNDIGIYILAKMRMSEMNGYFLENTWKPNIFVDSNVPDEIYSNNKIDADINRFAMISNYTLERSYPQDDKTPFYNPVEYLNDDVYGKGVRYYTNRDLAIIYLPYSAIRTKDGTTLSSTSNFGLALNLNYKSSDWYAFEGDNPTGYVPQEGDRDQNSIPHFENRLSYIHFDKNLNVIQFARPQS